MNVGEAICLRRRAGAVVFSEHLNVVLAFAARHHALRQGVKLFGCLNFAEIFDVEAR